MENTKSDDNFSHLMKRVCEGSEEAAWELVSRYGEDIRTAVRRVLNMRLRPKFDSLDFVQIVWSSFFRVRDKCERFQRPEELAAYLVTMARNKVGMEVRRRLMTEKFNITQEQSMGQPGSEEMVSHQPSPLDVAIARERWENLLKNQPEHYRRIVHLRLQGYTCEEIGAAVHLNERTVRRFLQKLFDAAIE